LFGGALAIGTNANASTVTIGISAFNFATAIGDNATALGFDSLFGIALQLGQGTAGTLGIGNIAIGVAEGPGHQAGASGVGAFALQLGPGTTNTIGTLSVALGVSPVGNPDTAANGFGNVALNLFGGGTSRIESNGYFNIAANLLGNDNVVSTVGSIGPSLPDVAFNAFGSRNTVSAGPGPLAFAESIFQNGATVTRASTGVNINGLSVPGVASGASVASVPRRTVTSAAPAAGASAVAPSTAAAPAQRPTAKAVSSRTPRKNTR